MFINCKTMRRVSMPSPDITSRYFKDIRRLKQLSGEEQLELVREYGACDEENKKIEIRNKLILANQPFIVSMARHLALDDDFNDLISEGTFGLIKAIEAFDSEKENKFLTYASYYIKKAMIDFQCNVKKIIKPKNVARVYAYSDSAKNKFFTENGRYPSDDELLEKLEKNGVVFSNKEDMYDIEISSIDTGFNHDDIDNYLDWFDNLYYEKNDRIDNSNVSEHIENISTAQMVQHSLSYLDEKEENIVCKYYGIGCKQLTPTEISYMIGANGNTNKVEKLISKCIKKIRKNGKV